MYARLWCVLRAGLGLKRRLSGRASRLVAEPTQNCLQLEAVATGRNI